MAKTTKQLDARISELENSQKNTEALIKDDLVNLQESLKPANLLKSGVTELLKNKTTQSFIISLITGSLSSFLLKDKGSMIKSLIDRFKLKEKLAESSFFKNLLTHFS